MKDRKGLIHSGKLQNKIELDVKFGFIKIDSN